MTFLFISKYLLIFIVIITDLWVTLKCLPRLPTIWIFYCCLFFYLIVISCWGLISWLCWHHNMISKSFPPPLFNYIMTREYTIYYLNPTKLTATYFMPWHVVILSGSTSRMQRGNVLSAAQTCSR